MLTARTARGKIVLLNIHLFNKFYCYYRERERNSYNTDDKNILLLAWTALPTLFAIYNSLLV